MGGGWGCPHEVDDRCTRIKGLPCDPGMKGCVLYGRFRFANDDKNRPPRPAQPVPEPAATPTEDKK
ncbi:hypothetical protein [Azospira inquinata]|uniref:Uncharacterized protein n=1 Tax=Azospira inquinata TaxID=2785627 RepID=A0A975SP56_9RHOO|nr:hypothetical protein [Azospira inquinata]QWT47717.1 hypothetical protein J8L76_07415 [Azospira inquinata]QWT49868.1 hypothetical protein Azoinq_04465 [Azospira inquinata]